MGFELEEEEKRRQDEEKKPAKTYRVTERRPQRAKHDKKNPISISPSSPDATDRFEPAHNSNGKKSRRQQSVTWITAARSVAGGDWLYGFVIVRIGSAPLDIARIARIG
ncbi:hypothetical protein GWI33_004128 [Rhynchophorus ferrugineus]|uniref:Uncharacterized protein n=1 Tax=Rhynchophorus ferrugineus TaxID=354439 RepID=A0A834HVX7_RHYFE|nr:hypothetical protein GWI33_004128 [Rhynchophorus ferrugineus]